MKSLLALLFVVLLTTPAVVYAETENSGSTASGVAETTITPVVTSNTNEPHTLKTNKSTLKNEIKDIRTTQKTALTTLRKDFKEELTAKRDELRATISAERAKFKAELAKLKDARKKALADKIDTKLSDINKNRTDRMAAALDKMSDLLTRLQTRITTASGEGKDTATATTEVTAAQTAINAAKSAVTAQAAKTYTAQITNDTSVGTEMGGSFHLLLDDLKSTYATIELARKALVTAIREVAHLGGIKTDTSVTVTPVVTQPISSGSAQ